MWENRPGGDDRPRTRPQFCPRCGRARSAAQSLCSECGETLLPQGYCAVCERYWRLPVGAPCPKHEIALEEEPPDWRAALPADRRSETWTTVRTFTSPLAAEAPRIRLEAEGIPALLEGQRIASHFPEPGAGGGVRLKVPSSLVAEARVLLDQSWTVPVTDADDDFDDAWESLAPEPAEPLRAWLALILAAVLLVPLLFALARLGTGR